MKKLLFLLPVNIAGRLIIKNLLEGFKENGVQLETIDLLDKNSIKTIRFLNKDDFSFVVSYDYSAVKFKREYNFDIPTINYFSDKIESETSRKCWKNYYEEIKKPENIVFYWDESLVNDAKKEIENLYYLPLFVNTNIYKDLNLKKKYDIMFAGKLYFEERAHSILNLMYRFPYLDFTIFSHPEHFEKSIQDLNNCDQIVLKKAYKGFIADEYQMVQEINKSKIILNFTSQGKESLNYRIYEVLACETFLLTDYKKEMETLFSPGNDIVYYNNDDDLISKVEDYLNNTNFYEPIIKAGRQVVEKKYSHKIAAQKMLETIFINSLYR